MKGKFISGGKVRRVSVRTLCKPIADNPALGFLIPAREMNNVARFL